MTDELVALATVEAAERTARTLITGIRECAETGHPLNELQQIALVKLALLEHDGLEASLRGSCQIVDVLRAEAVERAYRDPAERPLGLIISEAEARDRLDWDAPL